MVTNKLLVIFIIPYIFIVVGSILPMMFFKTFEGYINSGVPLFSLPLVVISTVALFFLIKYSEPNKEDNV